MKLRTLKNALILTLLALLFSVGVCFTGGITPSISKAESSTSISGYYEVADGKGVLKHTENFQGTASKVTIVETGDTISISNVMLASNELTFTGVSNLILGDYYTLNVVTSSSNYSLRFQYVTKAISNLQDCKVLDLSTTTTLIDGYYVLENDLNLGDSWVDAHQGVLADTGEWDEMGFKGTFDGKGYNITFKAGLCGFFGSIYKDAVIKNVAFTNVTYEYYSSGTYKYQGMPIMARRAHIPGSSSKATISNVYIHSADNTLPAGAIIRDGTYSHRLITENIIIKLGKPSAFDYSTRAAGKGAFIAWEYGAWYQNYGLGRDPVTSQVYVISGHMLGVYCDSSYEPEVGAKWNTYGQDYFTAKANGWLMTYAANEGVTEDLARGQQVYQNIKKYLSYESMMADNNAYEGFNSEYWDLDTYGAPVWRRALEPEIIFETEGEKYDDFANIYPGQTVTFSLGVLGVPFEGGEWSYEFVEQSGDYVYDLDAVTISDDFVATGVKEGTARVKITAIYEGVTYTTEIRIYVLHKHTFESGWTSDAGYHWHASTCGHTTARDGWALHDFVNYTCTVCDRHNHAFATEWSLNDTHHWKEALCEHSDLTDSYALHSLNATGTCECGYHEHTYSSEWSMNETEHWKQSTCEHDLQTQKANHSLVNGTCECGYHVHQYEQEWSSDAIFHWKASTCGHDDLVLDKAIHNFESGVQCTVCDYQKVIDHQHTFEEGWTYDKLSHWHAATCEHTVQVKDKENHILVNGTCECGYHEHQFSEEWEKDATFHWYKATCEHSTEISGKVLHDFNDADTCIACGYVKVVEEHVHTYNSEWTYDTKYHWNKATCEHTSEVGNKAEHSLSATGTCECGYHEHKYSEEYSKDASFHWYSTLCGHDEISGVLVKAGHDFSSGDCVCGQSKPSEDYEPDHQHEFYEAYIYDHLNHWHAASCGHTSVVSGKQAHSLNASGTCVCGYHEHTYSSEWSKDASFHWHMATCEHSTEISDRTGHTFNQENICTDCGYVKLILEHVHTFDTAWQNDSTYHWHMATCEHIYEISQKEQHELVLGTCKCGYHEHTYSNEYSFDQVFHWYSATCEHSTEILDKAGHNFVENVCSDCGYTVAVHQHTYSDKWTYDKDAHWHMATCEHAYEFSDAAMHSYDKDGNCICGRHEHQFSEEWSFNKYYHYYKAVCAHTNQASALEEHTFIDEKCTVCGFDKHEHTFAIQWTYDDTYHWHDSTCGHSEVVKDKAEHSLTLGDCSCGYHVHQYENTWTYDNAKHWYQTTCGHEVTQQDKISHELNATGTCECGYHVHQFATEWTTDGTYHWHMATCEHTSEISGKAEHSLVNGTCECGYHVHQFATEWTTDGTHHWHIATCEHTSEISGKAEHSLVNGTCECGYHVHQFATEWTTDGTHHWHASTCEHTSEITDKAEHNFVDGKCSVCDYTQSSSGEGNTGGNGGSGSGTGGSGSTINPPASDGGCSCGGGSAEADGTAGTIGGVMGFGGLLFMVIRAIKRRRNKNSV